MAERQSRTHRDAMERLEGAREEEQRHIDLRDAALGSPDELPARAQLQAAEEQTAAREAWVLWTERDYYHRGGRW
jgi:hypothetical protein